MKKICIVNEKNEKTNKYEIKTIVIFEDNKAPVTINYEGAQNLLSVVAIAEENGIDVLQNGIKPAIEAGLVQIVSLSNEKEMADLKANIIKEELEYMDSKEEKESLEKEDEKVLVKELKPVVEEEKTEEVLENKINAETTMFKPRTNGLPIEESEYAEYLKLNIKRANGSITEAESLLIDQMATYNKKVANMEKARLEVIEANKKVKTLSRYNGESLEDAVKKLNEKQAEFDELAVKYRSELARAVNKFTVENVEEEKEEKEETVETPVVEINKEAEEVAVEEPVKTPVVEINKETEEVAAEEPVKEENKGLIVVPTKEEIKKEVVETPDDALELTEQERKELKEEIKKELLAEMPKTEAPRRIRRTERFANTYNNEEVKEESKKDDDYKPNFILVRDNEPKKAENVKPINDEEYEVKVVDENGKEETVKAKTTSKFKKFLKSVGLILTGAAIAVGSYFGIKALSKKRDSYLPAGNETQKTVVIPGTDESTETSTSRETTETYDENTYVSGSVNVNLAVAAYVENYNVPEATRLFLQQPEVVEFLARFQNAEQLNEVISALCYGYEANILTTKDGNFRLNEDGENYLTSFTHDFLCAKAVVNRYDARQMAAVFGGDHISYEELMNGFKEYTFFVKTYFMNATEQLPFHYLTNNDPVATKELNELQKCIIDVNVRRNDHTLTSTYTDNFIAKVFDLFVVNDETINMSEGAKTVGAAIVEAYCCMQAQVDNEEALYLHENRGYALAGSNLAEVDGHFTFNYPDKTHYEFTSLFDVMNHGYGDVNETAYRCLSQQEELLAAINTMQTLDLSNVSEDQRNLEYALYQEGLDEYAEKIHNGNLSDRLLDEIASKYPMFSEEIDAVKYSRNNRTADYVPFREVYEGVDELLGIKNREKNNYAVLTNVRRDSVAYYSDYTILVGKRYTRKNGKGNGYGNGGRTPSNNQTTTTTETTTVVEKVEYEDLTPEEKVEVEEQIQELQQQEEQEHKAQEERIDEVKEELREEVKEGKTQEQLEEQAAKDGIDLDDDYAKKMGEALKEQEEGEQKRKQIEAEIEENNRREEEAAAKRAEEERKKQEEERAKEEELIRQSMEIEAAESLNESSDVVEAPVVVEEQQQTVVVEQPTVVEEQQQTVVVEQPTVVEEQQQTVVEEQPTVVEEEPAVVEEPVVEEIPVVVVENENPAPIEEGTSYSEDHDVPLDQNDENRVDVEAGEEPYIPSAKVVEELKELRAMALDMNVEVDDLHLVKTFGGRA